MRSTRTALATLAAGGALAALLIAPGFATGAPDSAACLAARAALTDAQQAERGTAGAVSIAVLIRDDAQRNLNKVLGSGTATPAEISAAQAQLAQANADLQKAQNAESSALGAVHRAGDNVDEACTKPAPTPAPSATPTTTPGPTTVIEKPGPTTIIERPGPTRIIPGPTKVITVPAPSGDSFGQIGEAPSGSASTGFGPGA